MQSSPNSSLDLLKAWYLATLRKRAVATQSNLTPAALINADRKQIERLILSGAHRSVKSKPFNTPATQKLVLPALGVTVVSAIATAIVAPINPAYATVAALLTTGSGVLSFWLVTRRTIAPFDQIGRQLADKGNELADYDSFPGIVDKVLTEKEELEGGKTLIVDASPDALCCLDAELFIRSLNGSLSTFLGYIPEELVGLSFAKLILPEDLEAFNTGIKKANSNEPVDALDIRAIGRNSQAIDLRLTVDWSGSSQLFFICAKDVTDEKRLERARTEYLSTISHDIKIPLTSVLLSIESLTKQNQAPEKQRAVILRVEASVEKLISLINELLEYEKSAISGRMPLRYSSVVVSELVDDAVEAIAAQAEAKQLELSIDCVNISAQLDRSKIQRTIVNLLSNAIKFTPGGGKISVTAFRDNSMLEFRVTDTGPGVPDEYKRLIFERYERIPDREEIDGTGLGLAICKTIVEAHRGLIGVKTTPGGGSEFWFNVPLKPS